MTFDPTTIPQPPTPSDAATWHNYLMWAQLQTMAASIAGTKALTDSQTALNATQQRMADAQDRLITEMQAVRQMPADSSGLSAEFVLELLKLVIPGPRP